MTRFLTPKSLALGVALCVTMVAGSPIPADASDHADPMVLKEPDANITDLFFFPDGDRYILILDVRRALTAKPPYTLEQYDYKVYFDLHTPIGFAKEDETARYGGTINVDPKTGETTIAEDRWIQIHLNNDATLKKADYSPSFGDTSRIQLVTGIYDDPFIFPRFFKKNTVAMIFGIPKSVFSADQTHFILWAATYKQGKQIDHVGRSNRTQQARFESLNTLPPSQHLDGIMKNMKRYDWVSMLLNRYRETQPYAGAVQILAQTRKYDFVPDVMEYSTIYPQEIYKRYFPNEPPGGFPNGRRLEDDVAARTCMTGDCILQELSFVEGGWPRARENDKPLSKTFPYLAPKWEEGDPGFTPTMPVPPSIWPTLITVLLVVAVIVVWFLYLAFLGFKYKRLRRQRRLDAVL